MDAVEGVSCCHADLVCDNLLHHHHHQHSNTYSALNALAGHYNSFGTNAPIPKKRLERIEKELGDAERLLERGR